ncbi:uncharacterized protein LOC130053232 [Ostrea edulis]|uniref:uncharacterized protein LOC130053232 n=1 Tax=Ostrea edulis TaxID=37623 RepID=UPI0024AE99C6|nr:uncharacterized protein LOC130053232 [Ostrea edulis]
MGLRIDREFMITIFIFLSLLLSNTRQLCETSTNQTFLVRKYDAPSFCSCGTEVSIGCRLVNDDYPDYYSCEGLSVYDRIQCCTYKHLVKCCSGWRKLYDSCTIPVCNPSCMNGGYCVAPQVCRCRPGYGGTSCQTPVCVPSCDNGGRCIPPWTCSCVSGYTGRTCSQGICNPSCLNGGQCVAPQICKCAPGFYGKICEKGDALSNLYTPTLQLADQSVASVDSWYRIASPYSKACFLKIYIQVNQTIDIVTFTSTSYDGRGNILGNYTALAVDEKNSIQSSRRSACLNIKCPEEGKTRLNTTKVLTTVNTDRQCNITLFDRQTSRVLGNNILETDIKGGDEYGPLYGIYAAYGSTISSQTVAEKMCQFGSNHVESDQSISPSTFPNAGFSC